MSTRPMRHAVVFGGAGFIGSNVAHRLLRGGQRVLLFDSLARPGVERNPKWLKDRHGDRLRRSNCLRLDFDFGLDFGLRCNRFVDDRWVCNLFF